MSADPYVVRSQRNRQRPPVPETTTSFIPEKDISKIESKVGLDHGSRSQLRMVRSKQHLGYFSTWYTWSLIHIYTITDS
jgi:hypothetical protein